MRKITLWGLVLLMPILAAIPAICEDELEKEYYEAMSNHYATPADTMAALLKMNIEKEDMPVVLHVAQTCKTTPSRIAALRERGESWMEIIEGRLASPSVFYFKLMAKIESKTFAPIFAKFKALPQNRWNELVLTDGEIRDMVNLKFIYSYHDFSVFSVMKMRDAGKDFASINNRVKLQKAAMIKEDKKKSQEAARKKKEEGN